MFANKKYLNIYIFEVRWGQVQTKYELRPNNRITMLLSDRQFILAYLIKINIK